jgi:hypothetical protein
MDDYPLSPVSERGCGGRLAQASVEDAPGANLCLEVADVPGPGRIVDFSRDNGRGSFPEAPALRELAVTRSEPVLETGPSLVPLRELLTLALVALPQGGLLLSLAGREEASHGIESSSLTDSSTLTGWTLLNRWASPFRCPRS